jgi:hypothetical protein
LANGGRKSALPAVPVKGELSSRPGSQSEPADVLLRLSPTRALAELLVPESTALVRRCLFAKLDISSRRELFKALPGTEPKLVSA